MSIQIKNNKLQIKNFSFKKTKDLSLNSFNVYLKPGPDKIRDISLLPGKTKEIYIDELNKTYRALNKADDIISVVSLISNNHSNNLEKITIQREMLENRLDIYSNYENKIFDFFDKDTIIDRIEKNSKDFMLFYETIEAINFNITMVDYNFGNDVINYFKGDRSKNVGRIIWWANKFLDIDYNAENFYSSPTKTEFLDELPDRFYDFKTIITKYEKQDLFIVNDLLIDQTYYSRDSVNQNYLYNTTEIVAQSLINFGRNLFLPSHTTSLINNDLQNLAFIYNVGLNKIKNISKISNYPIIKINNISDFIAPLPQVGILTSNFSNEINFQNAKLPKNFLIIENNKLEDDLKKSITFENVRLFYASTNDKQRYISAFNTPNYLKTRFGPRKPLPQPSTVQNSDGEYITNTPPVKPVTISFKDDAGRFTYFSNDGRSDPSSRNVLDLFYSIKSENDFSLARFIEKIDLNKLIILFNNLFNNIKLITLSNNDIDIESIKNSLKDLIENKTNLLIGDSLNKGIININDLNNNIFINNNGYLNNFSKSIIVNNTKINSTSVFVEENLDLSFIEEFRENFKEMIHFYYANNILKNKFEFFKKIYSDFSSQKFKKIITKTFDYNRDMVYSRILLNKNENSNNIARVFFAKTLSNILKIDLEENLFENQNFNIDINYDGQKSDLINITKNFICFNDVYQEENETESKIYSILVDTLGSVIIESSTNIANPILGLFGSEAISRVISTTTSLLNRVTREDIEKKYESLRENYTYNGFDEIGNPVLSAEAEEAAQTFELQNASLAEDSYAGDNINPTLYLTEFIDLNIVSENEITNLFIDAKTKYGIDLQNVSSQTELEIESFYIQRPIVDLLTERLSGNLGALMEIFPNLYDLDQETSDPEINRSYTPALPTKITNTHVIPYNFNARTGNLLFSKTKKKEGGGHEFEKSPTAIKEENQDLQNIKFPRSNQIFKILDMNTAEANYSKPIDKLNKEESIFRSHIFLKNEETFLDLIFETISTIIKTALKKEDIEAIKSQDDIVSFIESKDNVINTTKDLISVYNVLYNNMFDKVFYLSMFNHIFDEGAYNGSQNDDLNEGAKRLFYLFNYAAFFVGAPFKGIFLAEIEKNRQIYNKLFENQREFNNILEPSDIIRIIDHPETLADFKSPYTISDYILAKFVNILRREDISQSSYADIIYSYLEDTIKVNDKLADINNKIQNKIDTFNNLTSELLDSKDFLSHAILENNLNSNFKDYFENTLKHTSILEKINKNRSSETLSNINFINDIVKPYHEKKYNKLETDINIKSNQSTLDKDILCIGINKKHIENINLNTIFKISVSLADHVRPDLYVYEKDFFYSPSFSSNSKILSQLCIGEGNNLEVEFNDFQEKITFFNCEENQLNNKISLITKDVLEKLVSEFLSNNNNIGIENVRLLSQKMFDDYVNSGKLENILKEVSNFPDKNESFTNSLYRKDIVNNSTIDLFTSFTSQEFLSLFNERQENFISNVNSVSEDLSSTIYDFEESKLDTKIYSYMKNFDKLFSMSDLRSIFENKEYYDFYFIEISPKDFIYKSTLAEAQTNPPDNRLFDTVEIDETISSNFDYVIKNVTSGLRRRLERNFSKNNYNYIVKIEEIT